MFSAGNITEKLRISQFDCRGETVVDLYAGEIFFHLILINNLNLAVSNILVFDLWTGVTQ